jgi:hypothetical protein
VAYKEDLWEIGYDVYSKNEKICTYIKELPVKFAYQFLGILADLAK